MDIRKVKKLIELMEESDIAEIEIKEAEESVRISRYSSAAPAAAPARDTAAAQPAPAAEPSPAQTTGHVLNAPMVGTFYRAPSPESPPFVDVGDRVKEGDTLCIIESMKMMNEVKADRGGRIEAVLVGNGDAVEFDQPIFTIT